MSDAADAMQHADNVQRILQSTRLVDTERYARWVATKWGVPVHEHWLEHLKAAAMGCAGEGGEVCDYVKKVAYHNHELDKLRLVKELGDMMFYIAAACNATGIPLVDVFRVNILKLDQRYPNGFSPEASRARKDGG